MLLDRGLTGPIIPEVNGANDTSNFDPYPDSEEEAAVPDYQGVDPFLVWDADDS